MPIQNVTIQQGWINRSYLLDICLRGKLIFLKYLEHLQRSSILWWHQQLRQHFPSLLVDPKSKVAVVGSVLSELGGPQVRGG